MRFVVICLAIFFFACNAQNSNETCDAIAADIQKAWNAAQNKIFLNGEYLDIYNVSKNTAGFLNPIALCVPNPNSWKFPDASTAKIAAIIQAGTIKLCQPVEFTAETDPEDFRFVERILFYFNQNYNTNVTATFVQKNSSNDCFDALKNGSVDVVGPNFSYGVFIGDIPRSDLFAVGCPNFVNLVGIAVSDNVASVDWADFLGTYGLNANKSNNNTATEPLNIVSAGFGDYLEAVGLFPNQNVTFVSEDEYIDDFEMGRADVLWNVGTNDFGPNGLGLTRSARFIQTDIPVVVGSFFKYNNC